MLILYEPSGPRSQSLRVLVNTVSRVSPRTEIGQRVRCHKRVKQVPVLSAAGMQTGTKIVHHNSELNILLI